MTRINVYTQPTDEDYGLGIEAKLAGWFDLQKATCLEQSRVSDGQNMVGVITGNQWVDEYLIHTAGGRWVINHDAHRHFNGGETYRFVTDEQALDWMHRAEIDGDTIAKYFGPQPEETGPGRPAVGPAFTCRFPADLLSRVDDAATAAGIARAEWLRRTAESAVTSA